jgi:lysylphosphatidylglycerol synthetase-like protein (DUF2156 family)
MALLGSAAMFAVFLALYFTIGRRERDGTRQHVKWGWLIAIAACAGVAVLIGAVAR